MGPGDMPFAEGIADARSRGEGRIFFVALFTSF